MTVNIDHRRPRLRSDIIIHKSQGAPSQTMLEDTSSHRTFILREQELIVVEHFDGCLSLQDVAESVSRKLGVRLSISSLAKFTERLDKLGLLAPDLSVQGALNDTTSHDFILNLDPWAKLLQPVANLFFSSKSGWCIFVFVLAMLWSAATTQQESYLRDLRIFLDFPYIWWTILLIYIGTPIRVLIHEFGHAMSSAYFTKQIAPIRISPTLSNASVTISAPTIWGLRGRGQRLVIALSGLYFQTTLLVLILTTWRYVESALFLRQIYVSLFIPLVWSSVTLLLPSLPALNRKTDGYFAFSYLVNIPNLASRSKEYIAWLFQRNKSSTPPVWLLELRMAQLASLIIYSLSPWLGLVILIVCFWGLSRFLITQIPSTGFMLTLIAALWGLGPYLLHLGASIHKSLKKGGNLNHG